MAKDNYQSKVYSFLVRTNRIDPQETGYESFVNQMSNQNYLNQIYNVLKEEQKSGRLGTLKGYNEFSTEFSTTTTPTTTTETEVVAEEETPQQGTPARRMSPIPQALVQKVQPQTNQPQPTPEETQIAPIDQQAGQVQGGMPQGKGLGAGQFQITDIRTQAEKPQTVPTMPRMEPIQQTTTTPTGQATPLTTPPPQQVGYFDYLGNAVERGLNRGEIADYISATGKTPTAEEFARIAELNAENERLFTSKAMQDFANNPDLESTLKSLPEIAIESIASLYRHGLARMGVGAVAGGVAGSVIPVAGTLVGAGTGALSGMSVAGLGLEVSGTIMEGLNELKIDTKNPEALKTAFSNPAVMDYLKQKAYARGIPIAALDAVSMGVAGKILGKPVASAVGRGLQVLGEAGIQGGFGATGELLAQINSGENIKGYEVLAEGLAEIPGSIPEVGIAVLSKNKGAGKDTKVESARLALKSPDMPIDAINESIDVGVGTGEISATQATELKQEVAKAREINAKIPAEIKDTELRVAAIGLIEERDNLNAQLETVDEAFKPAIQEKIKGINEQLQELSQIPQQQGTQAFFETNQPSQTNPLLRLPESVDAVMDKIDQGVLVSAESLFDVYNSVQTAIRETLANRAITPEERSATINILSGMLTDIDRANTEGQRFVEQVEEVSVQDRVPAVREGVKPLPQGQAPKGTATPSISQAKAIREENRRKQAGTTTLPSSGQTIITPAPATATAAPAITTTETSVGGGIEINDKIVDLERRRDDESDIKRDPISDDEWHSYYEKETYNYIAPNGEIYSETVDANLSIEDKIKQVKEAKNYFYNPEISALKQQITPAPATTTAPATTEVATEAVVETPTGTTAEAEVKLAELPTKTIEAEVVSETPVAGVEAMTDRQLQDIVGVDVFKAIQRAESQLGEGVVDRKRLIDTAKKIQQKDNKPNLLPEHIFEALQYETGYPDNWQDLRNAIQKGGIDANSDAIQRQIEVGIELPTDIVEEFKKSKAYENASPELITKVEQLLTPTQDAVQKQTASQVPVQSGTTSSQEVAKGEPKAEPQSTADKGQAQATATQEEVGGLSDESNLTHPLFRDADYPNSKEVENKFLEIAKRDPKIKDAIDRGVSSGLSEIDAAYKYLSGFIAPSRGYYNWFEQIKYEAIKEVVESTKQSSKSTTEAPQVISTQEEVDTTPTAEVATEQAPAKKTLSEEFGISADDVNNLVEQKRKTFEGYSVEMALQELGVPQDKIVDALPVYVAEMLEGTLPTKSPTKKQKISEDLIPEGEIKIQPIPSKGKGKPAKTTEEKIDLVSDATDNKSTRDYAKVVHKNADNKEVVATDAHVMIVVKDDSITETESVDVKTGQKADVRYPDYKSVIPDAEKRKDKKRVNAKTIYDLASGIAKATKMFTGRIIPARIVIGDTELFVPAENLKRGLEPFVRSGITDIEISVDGPNRAIVFKGGDITSIVMPVEYKGENAGYTTIISEEQVTPATTEQATAQTTPTAETTTTTEATLNTPNETTIKDIEKIENATEKGRELALSKPVNKWVKRAFDSFQDLSSRAKKAGIYDGTTLKIGGKEYTVDTPAKFKAFLAQSQANFDAINEAVKGVESFESVTKNIMGKFSDIENKAKQEETKTDKASDDDVVLQSGFKPKQILAGFRAGMKALGFGDKFVGKVATAAEDWTAKAARAAMRSKNSFVAKAANNVQGFIRNIARTDEEITKRRRALGTVKSSPLVAMDFYNNAVGIVGNDPRKLQRVHQVLDPEAYEGEVSAGNIPRVTEADLNPDEKQLYDILRFTLDYIHDWHYQNGFIKQETYDKYKGTYSPRFWEDTNMVEESPELAVMFQQMGKALDRSYIKQRKDIDDIQSDIVEDPVYGAAIRMAQTLRNQSLLDYASQVSTTKAVWNGTGNPPPGYVLLEGPKYGALNGKYVARDVAEDFKGYYMADGLMNEAYRLFRLYDNTGVRQFVKQSKTVFNPITLIGNAMSNFSFAFAAGVDPANMAANVPAAAKSVKDKDADYKYLVQEGVLGTDVFSGDIKTKSESVRRPTSPTQKSLKEKLFDTMDMVRDFYGATDDVAKVAVFRSLLEQGKTREQAAKIVYESTQNYNEVGRAYDFASKMPFVGNPYIKFKADLTRIVKNGITRRPLTTAAYITGLYAIAMATSKLSDEEEEVRKAREARSFIPKIPMPDFMKKLGLGDVPLVWQTKYGEVNAARLFSPMYVYDTGEEGFMGNLAEITSYLPIQAKATEEEQKDFPFQVQFSDPLLGPLAQLAFYGTDFRGKQILDPTRTKFKEGIASPTDKLLNASNYLANAWVPFYDKGYGVVQAVKGEEDYYGRVRNWKQALVSAIIKVQDMSKPEVIKTITKDIEYKVSRIENIEKEQRNLFNQNGLGSTPKKEIEKIQSNDKFSADVKKKKTDEILESSFAKYADLEERKAKIVSSALQQVATKQKITAPTRR